MDTPIPLSQKLYFLAIHPEKGGIISWSYTAIDYVVIGSLLMELYQLKKIRFDNKRVIVVDRKSENSLHKFMLEKMSQDNSPRKISTWISRFHMKMKVIKTDVQQSMVDKRLIKMEPKKFLFFRWKKPVILDRKAIGQLERELRSTISKGTEVEDELILLSFIEPGGLLFRLFPEKAQRREAKKRLGKMMVSNRVSAAVADAISTSQAVAASIAVTAATSAATR